MISTFGFFLWVVWDFHQSPLGFYQPLACWCQWWIQWQGTIHRTWYPSCYPLLEFWSLRYEEWLYMVQMNSSLSLNPPLTPTSKRLIKNQVETDEKLTLLTEKIQKSISFMMDQTNISKSLPAQKDTLTSLDPTTVVPTSRRDPPLEGWHSTKIGGMWNLKHDISSPKFYELLINTELKGDTALDLKNFFNHIKVCLNEVTRLREDLLPDYQSIRRLSEFEWYFFQIVITLTTPIMSRYTLPLDTHF